ncbi:hypothetical protein C9374_011992 [Naegleria lovaniensis]|uniref:Rho GTPase activating protein n=1 Tax=Naegleria lovaniensis TaxID=51637 RepID=A0AA88GF99_NAELO|nr:uncharacterized protein C9374_011992 [Naegleria lovaniensis]KAG2373529.1 hypothetical protein C9374_011992 [Naegleria lovaniensis]
MFDPSNPPPPKQQNKGFFISDNELFSNEEDEDAKPLENSPFCNREVSERRGSDVLLKVTIKSCDNLISADWNGFSDPYCECRLFTSTPIIESTLEMNHQSNATTSATPASAANSVESLSQNELAHSIGATLAAASFSAKNQRAASFFNRKPSKNTLISQKSLSHMTVKRSDSGNTLIMEPPTKDETKNDQEIKEELSHESKTPVLWSQLGKHTKSSIIFKNLNPRWGEQGECMTFHIDREIFDAVTSQQSQRERTKFVLRIDVFDYDKYTKDDVLGHCVIDLEHEHLFSIYNTRELKSLSKSLLGVKHGVINFDIALHDESTIFGIELQEVLQRPREHGNRIPKCIDILYDYLIENCCETEGVLRIPGARAQILNIKRAMDSMIELPKGKFFETFVHEDVTAEFVHTALGVMKEYLRLLPTPIIQYELYEECLAFIEAKSEKSFEKFEKILRQVNRYHIPLFIRTLDLIKKITDHALNNKMTPRNVGIVMGPNLLKKKHQSAELQMRHTNHIAAFVEYLIQYYDQSRRVLQELSDEGFTQDERLQNIMDSLQFVDVHDETDLTHEEEQVQHKENRISNPHEMLSSSKDHDQQNPTQEGLLESSVNKNVSLNRHETSNGVEIQVTTCSPILDDKKTVDEAVDHTSSGGSSSCCERVEELQH